MNQNEATECLSARIKEKIRVMKSHIERTIIRAIQKHIRRREEAIAGNQASKQGVEPIKDFQGNASLCQE